MGLFRQNLSPPPHQYISYTNINYPKCLDALVDKTGLKHWTIDNKKQTKIGIEQQGSEKSSLSLTNNF